MNRNPFIRSRGTLPRGGRKRRKRRKRRPSLPPPSSIKRPVLGEKITLPQSSQMDEGSDDRRCLHRTNRRREAPLRRKRHGQRRRRQKWRAWNPAAPKSQRAETPIEGVQRRRRRRWEREELRGHGEGRRKGMPYPSTTSRMEGGAPITPHTRRNRPSLPPTDEATSWGGGGSGSHFF